MKICRKCKQDKEVEEFSKDKSSSDGRCSMCKQCTNTYKKSIRTRARELQALKMQDSTYREYIRTRDREWRRNNPILHLYRGAKKRAKEKGLEFNIEHSDVVITTHCPILGVEFVQGVKGDYQKSYSLDRIDSSKGYIKGNVRVISMRANTMKNNATYEELMAFALNIKTYMDEIVRSPSKDGVSE